MFELIDLHLVDYYEILSNLTTFISAVYILGNLTKSTVHRNISSVKMLSH